MIESYQKNSTISDFLSKYPVKHQSQCLEAVIIYGILTIKSKFPYGLSAAQLVSIAGLPLPSELPSPIISISPILVHRNNSSEPNSLLSETPKPTKKHPERFRKFHERLIKSEQKPSLIPTSENHPQFSKYLKEPKICEYETAKAFFSYPSEDFYRENLAIKSAVEFLKSSSSFSKRSRSVIH